MKFILYITLFLVCLNAHAQDTINVIDSKGRKQGSWIKKYENGKTRYAGQFKNDKPIGTFKYFDTYGVLTSRIENLENDSAKATFYHDGTHIMSEGKFFKQSRVGIWKFYDLDGDITSQCIYVSGEKDGPARVYYKDGRIAKEENFKKGLKHGPVVEYFTDGKVKFRGEYRDDNLNGKVEWFHTNGARKVVGNYQFAVREGGWMYYDSDNKLNYMEFYKEGFVKWRKSAQQLKEENETKKMEDQPNDSSNVENKE